MGEVAHSVLAPADGDPDAPGQPQDDPGGPAGQQAPAGAAGDPDLAEAQEAMERGDLDAAEAAFEKSLAAKSPGHPVATIGLAQVRLVKRVNSYDQSAARRAAAENPGDVEAQIRVADIDMAMGRIEDAFDRLIGTIRRTAGEDKDRARLHLLSLFDVLPPRDPRVARARVRRCPACCSSGCRGCGNPGAGGSGGSPPGAVLF